MAALDLPAVLFFVLLLSPPLAPAPFPPPPHLTPAQALVGLCGDVDEVSRLALPPHWCRHFFLAALCLELQHNAEALSRLQVINQVGVGGGSGPGGGGSTGAGAVHV